MACFRWIDQIKLKLTFTGSQKVLFFSAYDNDL